jgi:hypothetical protein
MTSAYSPEHFSDVAIASIDFTPQAKQIVAQMRGQLAGKMPSRQRDALERLKPADLERIAGAVRDSFSQRKMGLKELCQLARRELAILVIHRTVPKYRAELLEGSDPIRPSEYFVRYYRDLFSSFGVPTNAISTVDPNLHLQLKKNNEFQKASGAIAGANIGAGPA